MKKYFYTCLSAIGVVSYLAVGSPTLAAIANFDNFSEGFSGTTITDEGITFFDLDQYLPADQVDLEGFSIESTDTDELLGSSFSSPNYLTTDGFVSGSGINFGRFGSARITTGQVEKSVTLDLFSLLFSPSNNTLTLEALSNGNLVASTSAALADFEAVGTGNVVHKNLMITGVDFDQLRLTASGTDDNGAAFIGIDNVRISVPEPTSALGVLAFAGLSAALYKRKSARTLG